METPEKIAYPQCRVVSRKRAAKVIADKIYAAFEEVSQRNTRPRKLIAERLVELAKSGTDFTIDDLWQELREGEPHLGRATVYRSVEMLVNAGLLDRIEFADGSHHYRVCGANRHHHHLTCICCHRVVEVDICLPVDQFAAIGNQTNFDIESHSLTLFGRCGDCRSRKALSGASKQETSA
ncbi:MAG: transcriptional repressor [Chloroflexi bacterium]|nr:MAG: transcriptional repressor [Chloroflexota bacterium]